MRIYVSYICLPLVCLLGPLGCAKSPDFGPATAKAEQALSVTVSPEDSAGAEAADAALREARFALESGDVMASRDPKALRSYALLTQRTRDYDLEAKAWGRVTALVPGDAEAWLALGRAQAKLGPADRPEALDSLRHAAALAPGTEIEREALTTQATLLRDRGLFDLARAAAEAAAKEGLSSMELLQNLVSLDIREGQMARAWDRYRATSMAWSAPPSVVETAAFNEAVAQGLQGFDESRRALPDSVADHEAYAKFLVTAARVAEALAPAQRAASLSPDRYEAWNLVGSIARQLEQNALAKAAYERSLALKADQPTTRSALEELSSAAGAY